MRVARLIGVLLAAALSGCQWTNPGTPAGSSGYLTKNPVWFGHNHFIGVQRGPHSPGLSWRVYVINVRTTPYTATESFTGNASVLSRDNLKIQFETHLIFAINGDGIEQFIERYNSGPDNNGDYVWPAYNNYIEQPFRMIARDEVQKYNGLDVKDNIDPISAAITTRLRDYLKSAPFIITQAVVGNIQYPAAVEDAVSAKLAATQILERKKIEISQVQMDAQKRVAEAKGIADAMAIINGQLTPLYLQHEAIEAQKQMVNSPNHTTIYIPTGSLGVPLVGALKPNGQE